MNSAHPSLTRAFAILSPLLRHPGRLDAVSLRRGGQRRCDHRALGCLLGRHLYHSADGVNRLDYRAWAESEADVAALQAYLWDLQAHDPQDLTHDEQIAYWVNLYNAETIRIVLSAYPIGSILALRPRRLSGGPWSTRTLSISGLSLSLYDVEHKILRAGARDCRLHYALCRAALSAPNLRRFPWNGDNLDRDLDAAAATYVNHPRAVWPWARGTGLSTLYRTYRSDFSQTDGTLRAHLYRYARASLRARLDKSPSITGYDYCWSLNARSLQPS